MSWNPSANRTDVLNATGLAGWEDWMGRHEDSFPDGSKTGYSKYLDWTQNAATGTAIQPKGLSQAESGLVMKTGGTAGDWAAAAGWSMPNPGILDTITVDIIFSNYGQDSSPPMAANEFTIGLLEGAQTAGAAAHILNDGGAGLDLVNDEFNVTGTTVATGVSADGRYTNYDMMHLRIHMDYVAGETTFTLGVGGGHAVYEETIADTTNPDARRMYVESSGTAGEKISVKYWREQLTFASMK